MDAERSCETALWRRPSGWLPVDCGHAALRNQKSREQSSGKRCRDNWARNTQPFGL